MAYGGYPAQSRARSTRLIILPCPLPSIAFHPDRFSTSTGSSRNDRTTLTGLAGDEAVVPGPAP
jgi:hypothetical protein